MTRLRAVFFDIDGTLLDSNDAHAHAWLDALRGHGRNVPFDLLRSKIGMGGDKLLRDVADIDVDSTEGRSITERRIALLKAHYLPDMAPLAGSRALVDRVRSRGLRCVAVTSATGSELADLLREAAVADVMDDVVTSDDADRTKPDPELVEVALHKLGIEPHEAIMIGDTPYDIAAATRAGVSIIAFRSGGWHDDALEGAVAIYDGPQHLASNLERSPIADGVPEGAFASPIGRGRPRRAAMRGM